MGALTRLAAARPRGHTLPPEIWRRRHAWMVRVLWAHVAVLAAWGVATGLPPWHAAVDVAPVFVCAAIASRGRLPQMLRSTAVCLGLLTASAVVVHLMHGAIEGHFHFFVAVSLLALYEEWPPFLLAFGFVFVEHGVLGAIDPGSVYNHGAAVAHPWRWAAVHALFIGALGVVCLVHWRMNEDAREYAAATEERFRSAFEDAPAGMALVDSDGIVRSANAALAARVGGDPVGRHLADLVVADDLAGRPFPAAGSELELRYRDGRGWGLWRHSPLDDPRGGSSGWISHCMDVSKHRHAEEELSWQVSHDALTGLPNRALFLERLAASLSVPGGHVAVLCVDIDDFRRVNDALGLDAGDRLVSVVAERLSGVLRPDDVVARAGGDEFTVLLPGVAGEREALAVAQRLSDTLREPILFEGEPRRVSASVGLAHCRAGDGVDAPSLLRDADAAMYRAKTLGKARCEVFDASMRRDGASGGPSGRAGSAPAASPAAPSARARPAA